MRTVLFALLPCVLMAQDYQLEVTRIGDGIYVHQSFSEYKGVKIGANGMIVEGEKDVLIIDTAWDEAQTVQLLNWIEENLDKPVIACVITHAHEDKMGGINILHKREIPTYGHHTCIEEVEKHGFAPPQIIFRKDTTFVSAGYKLDVFYPGPGHAPDNLVVGINNEVLYGGCFLKSGAAKDLGNLSDANIKAWPKSLSRVKKKFGHLPLQVPGHGAWDNQAIENTFRLLKK